jgi:hypothetical protein
MGNPVRLFGKIVLAGVRVVGYTTVFLVQVIWFLAHSRKDKVGDAFGSYGKQIIDAVVSIFDRR